MTTMLSGRTFVVLAPLLALLVPSCEAQLFFCHICTEGYLPTQNPTFDTGGQRWSCSDLQASADNFEFSPEVCGIVQAYARQHCGCEDSSGNPPPEAPFIDLTVSCNVCGGPNGSDLWEPDPSLIDEPVQTRLGLFARCGFLFDSALIGAFSEKECANIQEDVREACGCGGVVGAPTTPTTTTTRPPTTRAPTTRPPTTAPPTPNPTLPPTTPAPTPNPTLPPTTPAPTPNPTLPPTTPAPTPNPTLPPTTPAPTPNPTLPPTTPAPTPNPTLPPTTPAPTPNPTLPPTTPAPTPNPTLPPSTPAPTPVQNDGSCIANGDPCTFGGLDCCNGGSSACRVVDGNAENGRVCSPTDVDDRENGN